MTADVPTWSTAEVADLLGFPDDRMAIPPQRLFPHPVDHPGPGARMRHSRTDVTAALIWDVLRGGRHRGPHVAWHAHVAWQMAQHLDGAPPQLRLWALVWPSGFRTFPPDLLHVGVQVLDVPDGVLVTSLLFLDRILAPLDR